MGKTRPVHFDFLIFLILETLDFSSDSTRTLTSGYIAKCQNVAVLLFPMSLSTTYLCLLLLSTSPLLPSPPHCYFLMSLWPIRFCHLPSRKGERVETAIGELITAMKRREKNPPPRRSWATARFNNIKEERQRNRK